MPVLLLCLATGCESLGWKHKETAGLRIHVESESSATGGNERISVIRSQPVTINIVHDPILTEADILAAKVTGVPGGGFEVQVQFDETAGWTLEQFTAVNPGKHLAIFGQWGQKPIVGRWLAAPRISRRIPGGSLTFTPDASREEMEEMVKGLNAEAKENAGIKSKD